jgi:nicotinate-nucleotide adenylyltransferase
LGSARKARVAIFGGAFDPVHNAHLAVARAAAERFHLDRVLFMPTYKPPHKGGVTHASFEDRVRMLELACAELGNSATRFEVSRLEEKPAPSYSIDTISKLRAQLSPEDEIFFIIGADAFAEIQAWHRWRDVVRAVRFLVVSRPGYSYDAPAEAKVDRLDEIVLPGSSSHLRKQIMSGAQNLDAPGAVIEYIRSHKLYLAR